MSVSEYGGADVDGSSVVGEGVVVHQYWGGVHQRGGDMVEQWGGHDLGLNSGGSLDNSLYDWGVWESEGWGSVEDWGRDGSWSSNWGSEWESSWDCVEGEGSWDGVDDWGSSWDSNGSFNSLDDWSGLDNWGGVDKRGNWGSDNWDSLGNWVNETVLVKILRESLEGNRGKTTWGLNSITESGGQRSSNWSIVDVRCSSGGEEKLGISFSLGFSLVKTVDSLVTSGEGSSVSRGGVGAVEVGGGVGVRVVGVSVGSVVVQRIGFRLSQTK